MKYSWLGPLSLVLVLAACTAPTPDFEIGSPDAAADAEEHQAASEESPGPPDVDTSPEWLALVRPYQARWQDANALWMDFDCGLFPDEELMCVTLAKETLRPFADELSKRLNDAADPEKPKYIGEPPAKYAPAYEETTAPLRHIKRMFDEEFKECPGENCGAVLMIIGNKWDEIGVALSLWD